MKQTSLSFRFTITFSILIVILIVLLSSVVGYYAMGLIRSEIGNSLSELSFQMADQLDHFMWSRMGEVRLLTELQPIKEGNHFTEIEGLLNQLQINFPSFSWIGFIDSKGVVRASTGGILRDVDISNRPVFMEGKKALFIGDVHEALLLAELLPNPSGEPLKFVDISMAVKDDEDNLVGVLAAHLSWEWAKDVKSLMLQSFVEREGAGIFIINEMDRVVLLGPDAYLGKVLDFEILDNAQTNAGQWFLETWEDEGSYLSGFVKCDGYQDYKGLGWIVLVRQPAQSAYKPVRKVQNVLLLFGPLIAIIFAVVGWLSAKRVTAPLGEIAQAADAIRRGEEVLIPRHDGIKEIVMLESSLSDLIVSLKKSKYDLGQMENMAWTDSLTKLPNRVALENFLKASKEMAFVLDGTVSIMFLDLDGFKAVNDQWGHMVGDELLIVVGQRLKACVREDEMVARLGGDEFVVVLHTGKSNADQVALSVAKRMIDHIGEPFYIGDHVLNVGCSVGIGIWPRDHEDIKAVAQMADEALYASKREGKNRATFSKR